MNYSRWRVNFGLLCLGVALIFIITRASKLLEPQVGYFTVSGAFFSVPEIPGWPAFLIRFAIPVVVGCLIGFLDGENPIGTAGAVGFFAAFIIAWPAFTDFRHIVDPKLFNFEYQFKFIHIILMASYSLLAMWGASLTITYLYFASQQGQTREYIIQDILDWRRVRYLLGGAIGAVITVIWQNAIVEQIFPTS